MPSDIVSFVAFGAFAHLTLSLVLFLNAETVWRHTTSNWVTANVFIFLFIVGLSLGKYLDSYQIIIPSFWFAFACLFLMQRALKPPTTKRYAFALYWAIITAIIIVLSLMEAHDWALTLVKLTLAGFLTAPLFEAVIRKRKTPVIAIFTAVLGVFIAVLEITWVFQAKKSSIELLFQFPFLVTILTFVWASPFLFVATETRRIKRQQFIQAREETLMSEQEHVSEQNKAENEKIVRSLLIDQIEHLIRQPLSSIRLYADGLAWASMHNRDSTGVWLKKLQTESKRLDKEISQLRSLFEINTPHVHVDLAEDINRALNALRLAWSGRNIQIHKLESTDPIIHKSVAYSASKIILSICLAAESLLTINALSCELLRYSSERLMIIRLVSDQSVKASATQALQALLNSQFGEQMHAVKSEGSTTRIFVHLP